MTAADVAEIANEVEKTQQKTIENNPTAALGQYTGASLEGGDARLSKFARFELLFRNFAFI